MEIAKMESTKSSERLVGDILDLFTKPLFYFYSYRIQGSRKCDYRVSARPVGSEMRLRHASTGSLSQPGPVWELRLRVL